MPRPGPSRFITTAVAAPPHFPWEWQVFSDEEAMSVAAATRLAAEIRLKPSSLVCLATGASPKRTYELLVARARAEPLLCSRTRWMKLDEWGGLAMDDPATCERFIREGVLDPLDVPARRYFGWHSQPADADEECARVAAWLASNGPIDLQVLGLGENGHLGFNEPGDEFIPGPHVAALTPESLSHSMLDKSRGRVSYGLTLGIDDLLAARLVILLVSGTRKARQLHRLMTGRISPQFPASVLQRHSRVAIYCDEAAAALCRPFRNGGSVGGTSTA
jgi:galactosamine-6-phosphate isomerase